MKSDILPSQEEARLAALDACHVLDTAQESCFDALTQLASKACGTPMALVSLVAEDRQWFKSRVGFGAAETPREVSFCSVAIRTPDEDLIIPDTAADARFRDNPLVVGPPHIRFYAGVPLVTHDGYALGTLCVLDDVPHQLAPEQLERLHVLAGHARDQLDLRRAFSEIRRLNEEFAAQTRILRVTNEDLQAFAYSVSHDLKGPLRRISTLVEDVLKEVDTLAPDLRANLERIDRESVAMRGLIEKLLILGRASTAELAACAVDLGQVAEEAIRRLRAQDPSRNVLFESEGDLTTVGDSTLLAIAVTNLIENAWKYSARSNPARIRLTAERSRDGTLIAHVEDNGIGFDPTAAAGRLFTPFQRLESGAAFEGTGVGLATVKRIIERHGGGIWAEGVPGKGATFHFTLPPPNAPAPP